MKTVYDVSGSLFSDLESAKSQGDKWLHNATGGELSSFEWSSEITTHLKEGILSHRGRAFYRGLSFVVDIYERRLD